MLRLQGPRKRARGELNLVPPQVHQFGDPQSMPVGNERHRGVPVAPMYFFRTVSSYPSIDLCNGSLLPSEFPRNTPGPHFARTAKPRRLRYHFDAVRVAIGGKADIA
jgi:hypothetical protein